MYVSITGLRVKHWWLTPRFYFHAIRSLSQAQKAPGNLHCAVKTINGVRHTLTGWESEDDMRAFIYSGAHREAIKTFRKIAEGKTFGFEAEALPTWDEVHSLWQEQGRTY